MNWFTKVITGVKALFGSSSDGSSNVMKVASGIGGFIDEQDFTTEEKAVYNAEMIGHFGSFMKGTIDENSQRSITRREIALWIMRNWIIMLWASVVAYGVELLLGVSHDLSEFILGVATLETMIYLVIGVGAFFFGAHIIRTYQK